MAEFKGAFTEYLPPDDVRTRGAITSGLVVVDANVLLDAYRYTQASRKELFDALEKLGDRLWIPHQAALEFHRNRASVIASHGNSYDELTKSISTFKETYEKELPKQIRTFANRVNLSEGELENLLQPLVSGFESLQEKVDDLRRIHGVSEKFIYDDPVLLQLERLIGEKMGDPLHPDEHREALKEAKERVDSKRPPGFKDANKSDPTGDYLVWRQSLLEAKKRAVPLVLVTQDAKDDWFQRVSGKTVCAHPALVVEAKEFAGIDFVAMQTKSFLVHANKHLGSKISDATLEQAEALQTHVWFEGWRQADDGTLRYDNWYTDDLPINPLRLLAAQSRKLVELNEAREVLETQTALVAEVNKLTEGDPDHKKKRREAVEMLWAARTRHSEIFNDVVSLSNAADRLNPELRSLHDTRGWLRHEPPFRSDGSDD